MAAWLEQLEAGRSDSGFGIAVLKSALAQLAAPTQTFKPTVNKSEMSVTAVLTTCNPDRQGDIIDPSGGDFGEHETNPIVMFHHGKAGHKLPLGKAEDRNGNYTVRLVKAHDGNEVLVGTTHFSQSNRFANDVFGLVAEDILRGVSIGFDPLPDDDCVEELGPSPVLKRPALHFKGWKLLEYSHTPLGVNRDALTVAVTKAIENPRLMHPVLLKYLAPMAEKSNRTTVVRGGATVRKAMAMPQDDDTDDDTQPGGDTDDDAGGDMDPSGGADAGYDPTSDDPSADPALKDSGYDNAASQADEAPPPTVQTLIDGSQGILDLCSAIESGIKKGEHMGGRKFAAKLCADLRATAAEAKQYADKVRGELSGAPMDADQGGDQGGDNEGEDDGDETGDTDDTGDNSEAPAPETDDEGAIVTKGYAPRRWTFADIAGQKTATQPAAKDSPDMSRKFKSLQSENEKLKKAMTNLLDDMEAGARRRA